VNSERVPAVVVEPGDIGTDGSAKPERVSS
jgi:hypothetical protein